MLSQRDLTEGCVPLGNSSHLGHPHFLLLTKQKQHQSSTFEPASLNFPLFEHTYLWWHMSSLKAHPLRANYGCLFYWRSPVHVLILRQHAEECSPVSSVWNCNRDTLTGFYFGALGLLIDLQFVFEDAMNNERSSGLKRNAFRALLRIKVFR